MGTMYYPSPQLSPKTYSSLAALWPPPPWAPDDLAGLFLSFVVLPVLVAVVLGTIAVDVVVVVLSPTGGLLSPFPLFNCASILAGPSSISQSFSGSTGLKASASVLTLLLVLPTPPFHPAFPPPPFTRPTGAAAAGLMVGGEGEVPTACRFRLPFSAPAMAAVSAIGLPPPWPLLVAVLARLEAEEVDDMEVPAPSLRLWWSRLGAVVASLAWVGSDGKM